MKSDVTRHNPQKEEKSLQAWLNLAAAWAARQERCRNEAMAKLRSWSVPEEQFDKILLYLEKENFLNEKRYAHAYVHDKFHFNHWGKLRIKAALRMKNVSDDIIADGLAQIDEDEYLQTLVKLLQAKILEYGKQPSVQLFRKLTTFAAQKGYESELVYKQVSALIKEIS